MKDSERGPFTSAGRSLVTLFFLPPALIFLISTLLIAYFWLDSEYKSLSQSNELIKQQYIDERKAMLRAEVYRIRDRLERSRETARQKLESSLQAEVTTAVTLAQSIYDSMQGKASDTQIKETIKATIRTLSEASARSYFFISDMDLVQILYPPNPSFEGQSLANIYTPEGINIAEQMRDLVSRQQKGFIRYLWSHPQRNNERLDKVSYISLFEPYGWLIGTGDYLIDFETQSRDSIFREIAQITYGPDDEGYFFINSYTGDLYLTNGEYFGGESNIWDVIDARGTKVVQRNAEVARSEPEGGFTNYFWRKNDGTEAEKLSFILGMDEWQIFIGTGAYLDTINDEIAAREAALSQRVKETLDIAAGVLIAAVILTLILLRVSAQHLRKTIRLFLDTFQQAIMKRARLDEDELFFNEFKTLARGANEMIDGLNDQARELQFTASHDTLTTLPNRSFGSAELQRRIDEADRYKSMGALLFMDLDNFKEINDTLGHSAGDELLRSVSLRISKAVRKVDTVARIGGDEFAVVTGLLKKSGDAAVVAQKILNVFKEPFRFGNSDYFVTASIGISLFPSDGKDVETLLRNADSAMYAAKHDGKNRYRHYTKELTEKVSHRFKVIDELRLAIAREEFELHYQPQIELRSGQFVGVEALIRWQHPVRGLVSPIEFIPIAENSELIVHIGEWVIGQAMRDARAWNAQGITVPRIGVNIAKRQLDDKALVPLITRMLAEHQCDPDWFELEITESSLLDNQPETTEQFDQLKALGLSLAIDDFGTGYSSLSYIKRLPINKVKIDRSFVKDIGVDENDRAIVNAIISIGEKLGLTVIAEGVEDLSQAEALADEGCHEAQGYLYGKPMNRSDLQAFIAKQAR